MRSANDARSGDQLCSPTRQALLTGRNHHSVGMGGVTEIATSAPGYTGVRPNTAAPLAETPDGTYDLVVEIEYPLLIVTLTGAVSTELTVQLDEQVFGPIQFGVRADECLAGVGYLAYTGALP